MPIESGDIRLLESERMTDTPDGGGRRTSRVIPDGVANNVFPKVSRLDSVYGRVNIRKLYGHVNTANVDTYAGAHLIITDAPDNPRIGVLVFASDSDYQTRTGARDFVENYVVAGPESRMVVYGRQLKGSSAVLAYQRPDEPLPEIGDVYCLSTEDDDLILAQQFVRVQDIAHELRTFVDATGAFDARVITMQIGVTLRAEFKGLASPSRISSHRGETLLRTTTVADAARYFGIQPLAEPAAPGDMDLLLTSVYAPIVPTTQREAAVSLAPAGGARAWQDAAAAQIEQGPFALPLAAVHTLRTSHAVRPGSVVISTNVGGQSTDDGAGNILAPAIGIGVSGTVDYENRTLTLLPNFNSSFSAAVKYIPQAEVSQAAHSLAIPITLATRGTVQSLVLLPLPAPGTATLSYRALGRWYTLRDRGDGEMVGDDPAYGTGLVDFVTGGAPITLGALPDVGSSIIVQWGSPVHYEQRLNDAGASAYQDIQLEHLPVKAGSVEFEYLSGGVTYTITDSAGALSGGGATGSVDYVTGAMHIEYGAQLPDFDSVVDVAYLQLEIDPVQPNPPATGTVLVKSITVPAAGGSTVTVGEAVKPGALVASLAISLGFSLLVRAESDGVVYTVGQSVPPPAGNLQEPGLVAANQPVGLLDAATGTITFNLSLTVNYRYWLTLEKEWLELPVSGVPLVNASGTHAINYNPVVTNGIGGALITIDTPRAASFAVETDAPVRVDLTRTSTSRVVPGSVQFSMAGSTYIERNGTLYGLVQADGSGSAAGTFDYASGIATPTLWLRGAAVNLGVQALLMQLGQWTATDAHFRTAGSPLRPASTYVQVTADDGTLLTGTSDQSGNIVGASMQGVVEQTMGVVSLRFGEWIPVAGNESESWFNPANVVGADVWKPRAVQPQTLRYSTVVLTNLPLSADILGLDPVRLPSDGRVPIFRPADVAVIHHTGSYDAGTPAPGATIDVGRTGLSALWLEDANRLKLAPTLYATDLDGGAATIDAGADLSDYDMPIAARHRIEEMVQVADVQINGQISLSAPLARAFPSGSQLSGALLFGDLFARVEHVFDQQTWTGEWSNTLIGSQASAQYNDIDYPIEVLNEGAVNERWRISFISATNVQIIGENLGVVGTQAITSDIAVVNALTDKVYFVLRNEGWGGGWPVGAQLRFNTVAAAPGFQLARVILPGATLGGDSFDLALRGDAD